MENRAAKLLAEHFGYDRFKSGQREVIEHLLAGRSAAAVFPTGGGKSLCYQLPALALPGITLARSAIRHAISAIRDRPRLFDQFAFFALARAISAIRDRPRLFDQFAFFALARTQAR